MAAVTQKYRLEIRGRAGWFVPAFESWFPEGTDTATVRHAMVDALTGFGYTADADKGETYHLAEWPEVTPGWCPGKKR